MEVLEDDQSHATGKGLVGASKGLAGDIYWQERRFEELSGSYFVLDLHER